MESHERTEGVNLRERQRLDSRKLGERFVKASHVLGELLRGVTFERHALLKAAHDKLMSNSSACTWKNSKYPFPCKGTTGGGRVIVISEHDEKGAERFSCGLQCLPKPVLDDSFSTKDIRGEKRLSHCSVKFLFLGTPRSWCHATLHSGKKHQASEGVCGAKPNDFLFFLFFSLKIT